MKKEDTIHQVKIPNPRIEVKSVQNKVRTLGSGESFFDKWRGRNEVSGAIKNIRKIAGELPKFEEKALKSHEVLSALVQQKKIVEHIGPAIEYCVMAYDDIAQVMSDIIDKILPRMLKLKYIPGAIPPETKKIEGRKIGGQPVSVINVDALRTLRANVGPLDRIHARGWITKAMKYVSKIVKELNHLERLNKEIVDKDYNEFLSSYKQRVKSRLPPKLVSRYKAIEKEQLKLILDIHHAVEFVTKEYNSLAFLEADINKIVRKLSEVNIKATNTERKLLPPAEVRKYSNVMVSYLIPFRGWLVTAREDNIAFQRTLSELYKIDIQYADVGKRYLEYAHILTLIIRGLGDWANTARIDQEDLQNHINESINLWKQLQQAN